MVCKSHLYAKTTVIRLQSMQNARCFYNIHEFSENYCGKMILNHTEKVSSSQILSKTLGKFLVTEKSFENLLEHFEKLKLNPPKVIRDKIIK